MIVVVFTSSRSLKVFCGNHAGHIEQDDDVEVLRPESQARQHDTTVLWRETAFLCGRYCRADKVGSEHSLCTLDKV
jgi:hypothetical protein